MDTLTSSDIENKKDIENALTSEHQTELKDIVINGLTVTNDKIQHIRLTDVNITYTDFRDCTIDNVTITGKDTEISSFDIVDSTVTNTSITNVALNKTLIKNTRIEKSELNGVLFGDVKIVRSDIQGTLFKSSKLLGEYGVKYQHCSIDDCEYIDAEIASTTTETNINNVIYENCEFHESDFIDSVLSKCSITDSELRGTLFKQTGLQHTDITDSDIVSVKIVDGYLKHYEIVDSQIDTITISDETNIKSMATRDIEVDGFIDLVNATIEHFNDWDSNIKDLRVKESDIDRIEFRQTNLQNFAIAETEIKEALIYDSEIQSAIVRNTNGKDMLILHSVLNETNIEDCKINASGIFNSTIEIVIKSSKWFHNTIANVDISGYLSEANILGGLISHSTCRPTFKIEKSTIKNTEIKETNLSFATISETMIDNVIAEDTNLSNACISEIDLTSSDISTSTFTNASFTAISHSNSRLPPDITPDGAFYGYAVKGTDRIQKVRIPKDANRCSKLPVAYCRAEKVEWLGKYTIETNNSQITEIEFEEPISGEDGEPPVRETLHYNGDRFKTRNEQSNRIYLSKEQAIEEVIRRLRDREN